jgi:predicted phosphodiesterase
MTRRFFIGGSAALGAFGGCRFLQTGSSFRAGEAPRLRFGVVSDVHICFGKNIDTFTRTLEYFRDQGADAVMICGDIVDLGFVGDLEAIAGAWEKVFPGNRAPDGRTVEKVFVTGNHDWAGHHYGTAMKKRFPDPAVFAKNVLATDLKGQWERIFDEPFSPMYMKDVKGYKFVGAHWVIKDCNGHSEHFNDGIKAFYAKNAAAFDPALPFFHAQHPHPRNTCYGSWAWGRDNGDATAALSAFPNAVAFSGHSHYPLTDERTVWQGAFTSVGTSSLRYSAATMEQWPAPGYENYSRYDEQKTMPRLATDTGRQGMLVSVYDDAIAIRRREFVTDRSLGGDWVMPLPAAESKPFAYAARAKSALAPSFAPGAGVRPRMILWMRLASMLQSIHSSSGAILAACVTSSSF